MLFLVGAATIALQDVKEIETIDSRQHVQRSSIVAVKTAWNYKE